MPRLGDTHEMTEQEAREMIIKISGWLEQGAPGNAIEKPSETPAADLAREFCYKLLEASRADGQGACPLCQGMDYNEREAFENLGTVEAVQVRETKTA